MSLRQRLTRGISLVLAIILVFMALTSMLYSDIEGFITTILPENITIAKSYERIAGYWMELSESTNDSMRGHFTNAHEIAADQKRDKLTSLISKLDDAIKKPERLSKLESINNFYQIFIKNLAEFSLLVKNRNRILRKSDDRRLKATQGLRTEITTLLKQFKSMLSDLGNTIKSPDFQTSLGSTSTLIEKISRIRQDLTISETEIAIYLSLGADRKSPGAFRNRKISSERVENRLRAVIFLLDKSVQESNTTLQKRVLSQILTRIKGFFNSFQKLKNILETPKSELIEIEDQLSHLHLDLLVVQQQGVTLATSEAEIFWGKISEISDNLQHQANHNHKIILIFLLAVLIVGIYLYFYLPERIGGPLQELSRQISSFGLGSNGISIPKSGTEEIDSLGKAFQLMVTRLNQQGEVNQKFLESIHGMTKIYRELHETKKRVDSPNERVEDAVSVIVEQLTAQCPNIDIAKVMIINKNEKGKLFFQRLGAPEISNRFKESTEFIPYCESVGYNPSSPEWTEERIPIDAGVTGWSYDNGLGIKTATDGESFFQPFYSPPSLSKVPTLANRVYEKGLNGCLVTEPINMPVPGAEDMQEMRGILFIYFLDNSIKLSWQEIFFIQIIASQIASVIETDNFLKEHDLKKKMDEQLEITIEIQENLLPRTVADFPGLSISYVNKAAHEVGGDYFDFFVLDKERIGVVIADAVGKGISAAIIMTVLKTTLSTMELSKHSTTEVLSLSNKIISKNITPDKFITAMYIIINSVTGEVEMSSAGHNPAIIVSGRGHNLSFHEKGLRARPLGILDDTIYNSINFKLKKGDLLFLYTDGVTEARDLNDEEFGESGLKKFLARPRGKKPAQDLLEHVQKFAGPSEQHDDITAISVEFNGR